MSNPPAHILFDDVLDQDQCVLFQLPGEVRQNIFYYALASYEDKTRTYDENTYWSRPDYLAPRRSDTTLLRCCKRIYNESWFIPFAATEYTFWLSTPDRTPGSSLSQRVFKNILKQVHKYHGDVEIQHMRYFAQMWALEGAYLQSHLKLTYFHPRNITLTIRHTDWWFWEQDEPLRMKASWIERCKLPASVRQFRMELESLERRKDQVNSIARQMKEHWVFTRSDGVSLHAKNSEATVTRWRGTSTWNNERWIRDETVPGFVDYYIVTVTWQREPDIEDNDANTSCPDLYLDIPHQILTSSEPQLHTTELFNAGVPPGSTAQEAMTLVQKMRNENEERRRIEEQRSNLQNSE